MLIKETDDEGSCERLLAMEQKNRGMLLYSLQVASAGLVGSSLVKFPF